MTYCFSALKRGVLLLVLGIMPGILMPAFCQKKDFVISSPNGNIRVHIKADGQISYSVAYAEKVVLAPSTISMTLETDVLGANPTVVSKKQRSVNTIVKPLFGMAAAYPDIYNEIILEFTGKFALVFRVYDNGVAYRFVTSRPGKIRILEEEVAYRFSSDPTGWMHEVKGFLNSYEEHYIKDRISVLDSGRISALPLLVESEGVKMVITESDLLDYPGLYLTYDKSGGLTGVLPPFVLQDSVGGCCPNFEKVIVKTAPFLAETDGTRKFPWRLMVLAKDDKDLLYNNLVYLLASENSMGDASWVRPGKVVWDWWCSNNLSGVDFKTGFNTETYKFYIDFAAANGIEYINMDEGWSDQFDLLKLNDGSVKLGNNASIGGNLDMPFLFQYAKEKNVGIILWCVWHTLDRQMDEALNQFQEWGVKGLKVDFMDRDDQTVVNFYERLARETFKRKMIVNFHGAFKPTGFERTFPNVINREAVQGLEYNKFSSLCSPEHAARIPFIRMVAGPMDYTPGGLDNVSREDFFVRMNQPLTQGTRCQQLAMFTIYYAPLEMLADAPTAYMREPEILSYLASIPTTWDETVPLSGEIGEYAVIARRKKDTWYVSGLTNWTERSVKIDFSFLSRERYQATLFSDGVNADRMGSDYKIAQTELGPDDSLTIDMAAGGGFALKLVPLNRNR